VQNLPTHFFLLTAAVAVAGNQLDLYSLDPTNETGARWINLTMDGITARHGHGFASNGKLLYVFGGMAGEANNGEGMAQHFMLNNAQGILL
jgi:hypothetical protein